MKNYKQNVEKDYELINDIYDYLSAEGGVVLLEPMSEARRDRLMKFAKEYPSLKGCAILEENDRRLYFRLFKRRVGFKSSMECQKEGDKAYQKGLYDNAIKSYNEIIEHYGYVNAHVFEMMGLSYLKKNEIDRAIPYLIISTYTSSLENPTKPKDYSPLINRLLEDHTNKSYVKDIRIDKDDIFSGREFKMNDKQNYGILNIKEIKEYAAKNGVTMEEAGNYFNLSNEQKDLLKLIVAREYFREGNFKQGAIYLNNVEETKAKTQKVREVLKEVRARRQFYQYKDEEKEKTLTYIKPGRRVNK